MVKDNIEINFNEYDKTILQYYIGYISNVQLKNKEIISGIIKNYDLDDNILVFQNEKYYPEVLINLDSIDKIHIIEKAKEIEPLGKVRYTGNSFTLENGISLHENGIYDCMNTRAKTIDIKDDNKQNLTIVPVSLSKITNKMELNFEAVEDYSGQIQTSLDIIKYLSNLDLENKDNSDYIKQKK